jgi:hypothetical protein
VLLALRLLPPGMLSHSGLSREAISILLSLSAGHLILQLKLLRFLSLKKPSLPSRRSDADSLFPR